ncbi:MAG: UPF0280 family protein [Candidatus Methanomethylophilaceae archaeon]|nr:UPF0280 family protein [Candidatus Methanomethylophilaceae archaeon]
MIKKVHFEVEETAMTIMADEKYLKDAKNAIFDAREMIKAKIREDPFFGATYDPYKVSEKDYPLIKRMCEASAIAGVGPMAAVAGAVASYALERIYAEGCRFAILDNGGDIAMCADRDVLIGIYQDDPRFSDLALLIPASDGIKGICSSSGRIGPSVSFGVSGITTVFADDPVLADACATSVANNVKDATRESVAEAAERINYMEGAKGCLILCGGIMASCGEVPEIVPAKEGKATSVWLSSRA